MEMTANTMLFSIYKQSVTFIQKKHTGCYSKYQVFNKTYTLNPVLFSFIYYLVIYD